jgi:hypothetical protein
VVCSLKLYVVLKNVIEVVCSLKEEECEGVCSLKEDEAEVVCSHWVIGNGLFGVIYEGDILVSLHS